MIVTRVYALGVGMYNYEGVMTSVVMMMVRMVIVVLSTDHLLCTDIVHINHLDTLIILTFPLLAKGEGNWDKCLMILE